MNEKYIQIVDAIIIKSEQTIIKSPKKKSDGDIMLEALVNSGKFVFLPESENKDYR